MRDVKVTRLMWLLLLLISSGCRVEPTNRNQEQPVTSPSGKYVLTVPIERAQDDHLYWRVTISGASGQVLFKDDSRFVGNLNVYWCWDDHDRVWLENSDDGRTYYWELDEQNRWRRYQWEPDPKCLFPPRRLYRK